MTVVKRKIWERAPVAGLMIGCVLLLAFAVVRLHGKVNISISEKTSEDVGFVLIDPGHGGEDGGAIAADGTVEKNINLAISLPLADMLRVCGYRVELTRDGDYSIYDAGLPTIREKKASDLKNRLVLFDKSRMTISIHQNHFSQSQYSGAQIFYGVNNAESEPLAKSVRKSILEMLQPENTRELKKGTDDVYLLSHTKVPAIFVECGFLSNPGELAKLKDGEYQQKMAYAIACGVIAYGV